MDGWVSGWVDRWVSEWMDGWMDGIALPTLWATSGCRSYLDHLHSLALRTVPESHNCSINIRGKDAENGWIDSIGPHSYLLVQASPMCIWGPRD